MELDSGCAFDFTNFTKNIQRKSWRQVSTGKTKSTNASKISTKIYFLLIVF